MTPKKRTLLHLVFFLFLLSFPLLIESTYRLFLFLTHGSLPSSAPVAGFLFFAGMLLGYLCQTMVAKKKVYYLLILFIYNTLLLFLCVLSDLFISSSLLIILLSTQDGFIAIQIYEERKKIKKSSCAKLLCANPESTNIT